ncbi:phage tail protein [Latilactobacillus curvatus]|uniref:phage tail spike protein n=1 Tax=Latilactobacillus curvatus TaxID=28038 RepID=UPI001CBF2D19|nr:phage tail spike protein [Latilactobacillus curvatus]MBZ1504057.1 phage tail protein [Latilactobacillus curvatus]
MSVPILYEANATDFNNLGLGPLVDTTVATVTEERNGQFILEMQYPVDGIRASLIAKNRILKVDAGHKLKDQRFVIKRINRIMGNDGLSYSIYAEHISYITADYALKPSLTVNGSGNVAMTQWLNGIVDSNKIHVDSDITTENTTSWTIDKVQNARQALGGVQGSILDVWGGEYRFDNLNISLLKHRGTVSNTLLSYGRNITDFDQEENITNTYTSIYPFASYSVQNGDTSEQNILTIPDLVVDSEYVKNFPNRKIQVVDFSDKFSTDEKPTVERLAELAKSYIKSNKVGVPTVSTKISFVDLSKTENYKEFAPLEELDLCDEVPFAFEKFGIKTTAKISRIVWNVLLDSYDSLELGELKTNLSDVINNTNNAALDAKDAANDAKNSADNAALSANGKNRNWYGADDPAFGHLSELREGDSWYMPNGEDTELYHWINGQWVFILSTKDAHDAADAADKASKEAEEAKKQANKAVDGANEAVAKAGFANDTVEEAKSDAAAAGQQAKDALTSAGTAITDAQNALTNSSSAMADSTQARKDSATAIKDAADSLTSAKDALNKVGSLTTSVTSQFTTVNNELKSKVNQTDYDKLKGTVTSQQTEINQNASGIKLKADKSYADTINNSVVKNTSSVGLLNDQIALTVSKAELNNTLSSYATQTWAQSQIKSTADSINLSVSKVQTNLDNMQIGSRNYMKNSSTPVKVGVNWGTNRYAILPTYLTEAVGKLTFSAKISDLTDNTSGKISIGMYTPNNANIGYGTRDVQIVDSTLTVTFDIPSDMSDRTCIYIYGNSGTWDGSATGHLTINDYKLERGNKATDWTPAPEDMATEVQFSQLQVTVNGIQGTVQNKADQSQVTQLANQISLKADTTALNELKGTVDKQGSEITLNTNSIKLKADQSSVNTLKGTVDKQGSAIDVNTKAIALKANQSAVDTLTGRVSTAEGKITVQADQIAQTVSKTELTTKLNDYATQTWTQGQIKTTADSINLNVSKVQTDLSGTKTQFAALEVKVNGIQTTVSGKADQSQVTQLANQITSTVTDLSAYNLITNTEFEDRTLNGWGFANPSLWSVGWNNSDVYMGSNALRFHRASTQTPIGWTNAGSDWIEVYAGQVVSASAVMYQTGPEGDGWTPTGLFIIEIDFYKDKTSDRMEFYESNVFDIKSPYLKQQLKVENIKVPEGANYARLHVQTNGTGNILIAHPMLVKRATADTYVSGAVSQSQITQLSNDINLRVQKGDVINQINISPESILIAGQKVHITGQTSIDNAVIKDAMIANVTADKITAGTLNAANVNVINLNANNITAGTIRGANLAINLNTGEATFQKGRIHSASNNVDVNIDQGYLSTASNDTRVMLKEGQLQLVQPTIFDNSKDPYLQISNSNGGASFNGANIIARDYLVLANRANSDAFFDAPLDEPETFAGLAVGKTSAGRWKPTRIGGADRGIIMRGGTAYMIDSSFMYKESPEIFVGTDAAGSKPSDRIYINGSFVHIPSAYWRTASGSANLMVAQDGALVRSTSASKYKTDIVRTNIPDYGEKLLNLPTATWTDIAETKRYRDDPVNQIKPTRNFGMIAEDLVEAGLEMLVVRGTDGELEGINYDRIGPALIPVIAKLKNEVETLKQQLEVKTA